MIAREGVEAVTHRSVGSEAGLSHGTVNYHFSARDEILFEAFRHYIGKVAGHIASTAEEVGNLESDLIDFLVEFQRREFADAEMLRAEYELILYAARNEALEREYRAWDRGFEGQLATALEAHGAPRPMEAARVVLGVCRAFELERLTRPETQPEDLRRRLELLLPGLLGRGLA